MNDVQRAINEYFYYILAGGLLFGLVVGIVLFILASRRGKRTLGIIALIASTLGGVAPAIVLVLAVVFMILIFRRSAETEVAESSDSSELSEIPAQED